VQVVQVVQVMQRAYGARPGRRNCDDRLTVGYHHVYAQEIPRVTGSPDGQKAEMMNSTTCAPVASSWYQTDETGAGQHAPDIGMQVLAFECQGRRFAVPLACVRRALLSAEPVPLPGASDIVLGVLNVGGEIVTVLDFARRAGCAPTTLALSQQFLVVDLGGFACALVVDAVIGTRTVESADAPWPRAADAAEYVTGTMRLADGLCLVLDPEKFLFDEERLQLAQALAGARDERG
jgi:purine-binding chemotaxis protein CheW